jgi:hypothetical protein
MHSQIAATVSAIPQSIEFSCLDVIAVDICIQNT